MKQTERFVSLILAHIHEVDCVSTQAAHEDQDSADNDEDIHHILLKVSEKACKDCFYQHHVLYWTLRAKEG